MKTNKWDLARLVLVAIVSIVLCIMCIVCIVEVSVRSPYAVLGSLFCGGCLFLMLSGFIEKVLEEYKARKKSEKEDEKV